MRDEDMRREIRILQIKPPVADGFVFANDPYFRDFWYDPFQNTGFEFVD